MTGCLLGWTSVNLHLTVSIRTNKTQPFFNEVLNIIRNFKKDIISKKNDIMSDDGSEYKFVLYHYDICWILSRDVTG